jgi:hypothetical protein
MHGGGRFPANLILKHALECRQEGAEDSCCSHDCPVAEMDRQSGNRPSNNCLPKTGFKDNSPCYGTGIDSHRGAGYGDTGGASRFFRQVQSEDELEDYLDHLIRKGR